MTMQIAITLLDFNSHAHVERDVFCFVLCKKQPKISTHTLTWSVTALSFNHHHLSKNFNSHAHVERDEKPRRE